MSLGYSTPQAQDGYSRTFVELFDDRLVMPAPKGFQAFFGRPEADGRTVFSPDGTVIDIDIIRGNEKIAPYIHRGTNGRTINTQAGTKSQEYSASSYRFPLAEMKGSIGAAQINERIAGESPYGGIISAGRLMALAREQHNEHIRKLVRLFEVSAAESALRGQQSAILGTTNADLIYDWQRSADNTITVANEWDDDVNATIMADIDEGCRQVRTAGHVKPDMMVVGEEALRAMLDNTDFQTLSDNRRIGMVAIDRESDTVPSRFQRFVDGGMIYRGILYTAQGYRLYVFTYPEIYTDEADATQDYMPTDEVLIASSQARCDRYFGPPEMLPLTGQRVQWYTEMFGFSPLDTMMPPNFEGSGIVDPRMFYFDAFPDAEHKNVNLRSQAAPLFPTTHTDAFVTLTGLITA